MPDTADTHNTDGAPQMPALLAFIVNHGEVLSAVGTDTAARHRVVACLYQKAMTLGSSVSALQVRLISITDPNEYNQVSNQITAAQGEAYVCQARADAINLSQPFNDPGPAEEAALGLSINNVNASLALTTAIGALLAAVDGLVNTYRAKST